MILGDLNNYFQNNNQTLDANEKVNITRQIAKGVAFLHIRDIVHRDIKPANILARSILDNNIIVKLGDFGLSKIFDPTDETSSMSSDVGTLIFKAPEFWDKKDDKVRYHRSVDVYASGLTFTAMLQAKPRHRLVPEVEGSLLSSETRMPIGLAAFTRCQNKHSEIQVVLTDNSSDTPLVRELKIIIEKMTYFSAQARISATEIDRRLNALQGNESNALLDDTANLSEAFRMDPRLEEQLQNLKQKLQKIKEEIQNLKKEFQSLKEEIQFQHVDGMPGVLKDDRLVPDLLEDAPEEDRMAACLDRDNRMDLRLEELKNLKEEIQNREEETQFQYEDGMTEGRQDDLPDLLEDAPEKERISSSPDRDGLPDLANAPDEKRISAFPDRDGLPDALEDTPEEEERMAACL